MLENLFLTLTPATDTLGMPLLKDDLAEIWEEQRRHIQCLQDPQECPSTLSQAMPTRRGKLLVSRCASGNTLLKSFHLHLARFVPGTYAINFWAFLLYGNNRWNQEAEESVDYKGYPGWDKNDALAQALLSLRGLSIKASQVQSIKHLYDNIMEFDKRPLGFTPQVKASRLRGRFTRSRSQSKFGHISIDCVKQ